MLDRHVLVFDGDCGFCTWSADVVARWSHGRLDVVPWQRVDLSPLGLTVDACAQAVQYVDGAGRWSGAAAIAHALMRCRQPGPTVGRLMQHPRVAPLAERSYRLVAANRHRLPGSSPACAA